MIRFILYVNVRVCFSFPIRNAHLLHVGDVFSLRVVFCHSIALTFCKKGCLRRAVDRGALSFSSHEMGIWSNALCPRIGDLGSSSRGWKTWRLIHPYDSIASWTLWPLDAAVSVLWPYSQHLLWSVSHFMYHPNKKKI